jgi:hypothetical protein
MLLLKSHQLLLALYGIMSTLILASLTLAKVATPNLSYLFHYPVNMVPMENIFLNVFHTPFLGYCTCFSVSNDKNYTFD